MSPWLASWLVVASTGCGGEAPPPETPDEIDLGARPIVAVEPIGDGVPLVEEPDDEPASRCDVACAEDGLCAKMDGACVAVEDSHCRQSKACRDGGRCRAEDHQCVKANGTDACDSFIASMRVCMAKMPPEAQPSLGTMLEALEGAVMSEDPETRRAMAENCKTMITTVATSPLCQ